MNSSWVIWQLVDSAFPSGGFAHSGGVETACQWRTLSGAENVLEFLRTSLVQVSCGFIPFLAAAHREPARVDELDARCDAFLSNHVANRASRSQGQGFLLSCEAAFGLEVCTTLRAAAGDGRIAGHFSPVFGVVTAALEITTDQAARIFLHVCLRDLISSAVRLNAIGPLRGQAIQHRLGPFAEHLVRKYGSRHVEDAALTAPVIDVLQETHDRLYSRLFQS